MKQKLLTKITVILMVFALVFSCLLTVVVKGNGVRPVSKTYETTLFQKNQVLEVNILMDEEEWQEMLQNANDETYVPCDVEVNGVTYKNVAIRPKGNTSLTQVTNDRYSFKIQFDKYQEGQTCDGLDQLVLNNNFSDATYMKEYIAYDMFQYLGVVTPLYTYADVKINGETYGLYLALEGVKESFAERNYGVAHGELYKPESQQAGMGGGKKDGNQPNGMKAPEGMPNMPEGNDKVSEGNSDRTNSNDKASEEESNGTDDTSQAPERALNMAGDTDQAPEGAPDMPSDASKIGSDPLQENTNEGETNKREQGFKMDREESNSSGTDLVYTDDNVESYSSIFDSAVFDTTKALQKKVIEALKGIATGENLEQYMNVEENLKYFAVNSFLVNYDSYTGNLKHNYYLYEQDGKLTMLPWDLNLAFAGFQSNNAKSAVNDPIDTPVSGTTLEQRPMLGQLLSNETYLEQYHNYLDQLVKGYIESGRYEAVITQIKQLIDGYVKEDPTAFYTYDEFTEAVENLEAFCKLRGESVRGQLEGTIPSTEEEQQKDDSSLVETGDLSITAMGTMGGGRQDMKMTGTHSESFKETMNVSTNKIEQGTKTEQVGQANQSDQVGQVGQTSQSEQVSQGDQTNQSGQENQDEQTNQEQSLNKEEQGAGGMPTQKEFGQENSNNMRQKMDPKEMGQSPSGQQGAGIVLAVLIVVALLGLLIVRKFSKRKFHI
ncbi:MAG: CotH kinase family protein [Clostridiales bacterium]|nr:CotH kinase family protein [Clostridiales bacterium]